MKTKRLIALLLAAITLLMLGGCRLAREDAGSAVGSDRLIGVFITTEYLDLFDFEGYIRDNYSSFSGGEIKPEGNTGKYEGRLYATLTERTLISEETGEETRTEEYVFEGVSGFSYFYARYSGAADAESYMGGSSDDAISDGQMNIYYGDDEEKISMEGTLYVSPLLFEQTYYINPVYQAADGSVYTTSSGGFMVSGATGEGVVYTNTMDEATLETENGKSKSVSTSTKINIATMLAPERIVIIQMDKDSNILARDSFAPEEVPDKLRAQKAAEYIILETHKRSLEGAAVITRELFTKDDEMLSSFYCRDDGVCIKQATQTLWN